MTPLLQSFLYPKKYWLAAQHMKSLSKRLRKYDLDVKEALNRLPKEIVDARNQSLKRAMNLSIKHEYLPEDIQAMQTPSEATFKICWPL
ncbi:Cytochrome b-c1 complex subunit 7 [Quillaja saponaria]|uniref:Cytochrome b-c1 complex subunit 7 n=1 Tax=Quillaja saponaria TaxID=32244 RepID=A0AAD7LIE0_QUISA|nr:Cytochrome b-c1 complex subunit 7 [Quillaja saponaria]